MGYSLSWIAVKGNPPQAVLDTLALRPTGERDPYLESPISAAVLPGGWYIVVMNRGKMNLLDTGVLAELSLLGEVMVCFAEEHVMNSMAACWRNGKRIWSVEHNADDGIEHLLAEGELPQKFISIRDEARAMQRIADQKAARVDYIFDVPIKLSYEFTAWLYDQDIPGLAEDAFEVLEEISVPRRIVLSRWWQKLFGK